MKIAVNTRLLIPDAMDGIGWFTYETLRRITNQHKEHTFYFIFDSAISDQFIFADNIIPIRAYPPARRVLLWYLYFEWSIPRVLNSIKPDLFISTDGWLSLSARVPSFNVIHDLHFEHYPEFVPSHTRKYYRYFFPKFAHKAKQLATVSEFTKNDLINLYQIPENKIDVVYNGVSKAYIPSDKDQKEETQRKFSRGCPYFLFVGTLQPRKNIANLIKAFDIFKLHDYKSVKLIFAGHQKWLTEDIIQTLENSPFKSSIIFTGRLTNSELCQLYGASLGLLYVSLFEGFGIPILEAMKCETPVITSKVTAMPEVSAGAALMVDPQNPQSIANAMQKLANSEVLRSEYIQKGIIRAMDFNWDETSEKLWKSIEKMQLF